MYGTMCMYLLFIMSQLQLHQLFAKADELQKVHGAAELRPIYGAGCINSPRVCFVFMNPTGRNISASPAWSGMRAPWVGTKNIWRLFHKVDLLSDTLFERTQQLKAHEWSTDFVIELYTYLSNQRLYLTNLAKCSQLDARHLHNNVFTEYLAHTKEEIVKVNPQKIITFGNQVSSILLGKSIKVSDYDSDQTETVILSGAKFSVYPTFYPVGLGMRNMPKALRRLELILKKD